MKNILLSFCLSCIMAISSAQPLPRYSIIITEVFADPSPSVGLPNAEYIELYNRSGKAVPLKDFRISDGSSTATLNSTVILGADSFLILCPTSAVNAFSVFGKTVGLSNFPSLNNEGDRITLYAADGSIQHAVDYSSLWYNNPLKAEGGWSLEMIDRQLPCEGKVNWTASTHAGGGTPGRLNSVTASRADKTAPVLLRSFPADSLHLILVFSETIDSNLSAATKNFSLLPNIPIVKAEVTGTVFNSVRLTLATPLQAGTLYEINASRIPDCSGNVIEQTQKTNTARPAKSQPGHIVFNELLFNPKSGGEDYIELYNRSSLAINLNDLYLANRSISGALLNLQRVSPEPFLLLPGSYIVVTADTSLLQESFTVANPGSLIETDVPSMPDDKGHIVLLNAEGIIIDELQYEHQWHYALLDNKEGVALERISPDLPTQNAQHWNSAASLARWGTPTAPNSQLLKSKTNGGSLYADPTVFSPDNDGVNDRTGIFYKEIPPGTTVRIRVYNAHGGLVCTPLAMGTLPAQGVFWWEGTDDRKLPLGTGVYLLVTELINTKGNMERITLPVTLVRKR